jgi:hypothetical protein
MMAGALALSATAAQAGAIAANSTPITFDPGIGSSLTVSGTLSGLAYYQTNPTHAFSGDHSTYLDLDNAMVGIAKTDGIFQFDVQAGEYDFPVVGFPYTKASTTTSGTFGVVPIAYAKLQLTDEFSVSAGKLPTLIGAELPFTTQNANIERGLLWNQEPLVSRGVQANYASGPVSVAVSWNDGNYTNLWNTFSGLISYAIDGANTLAFDASITGGSGPFAKLDTYNLMYTYSNAPWTVGPYLQYQTQSGNGNEWGIGLLASYQFTPEWSLNGRVEYEDSSNSSGLFVYGPGSNAFSATITPTWQKGIFFVRGELSYASLGSNALGFGTAGNKNDTFRALLETGISF